MRVRRAFALALSCIACMCVAFACGETRKGPGEECLRSDDCLSGFCTDRVCTAAPTLGTPADSNLDGDAGLSTTDATTDASADAGSADSGAPADATSG